MRHETYLKSIFSSPSSELSSVSLIVITEFDKPVTSWRDDSDQCWLETRLPAILPGVTPRVWAFEPRMKDCVDFSWHTVSQWGDMLLHQILDQLQHELKEHKPPRTLLFICHGLGGLILKRAIGVLFERFSAPLHRYMITLIAGIVFLGSPSPVENRHHDLTRMTTLLETIGTKSGSRARPTVAVAAAISQRFTSISIEAPVLSVYETRVSRTRKSFFAPRQVLVDKAYCETLAKRERLLGVDSTHQHLCNIEMAGSLEYELTEFFALVLELEQEVRKRSKGRQSINVTQLESLELTGLSTDFEVTSLYDSPILSASRSKCSAISTADNLIGYPNAKHTQKLRPAKLPCFMFGPARNPEFMGREDILQILDDTLLDSQLGDPGHRSSLRSYALCGVGGLGKTQIATEYVYSRKHHFNAIFWVHAGDPASLANDFTRIAVSLDLEQVDKTGDQQLVRNLVLQWLSTCNGDSTEVDGNFEPLQDLQVRWLLVFDNADSLADIQDYWPMSGTGSILITSRDPLAKTNIFFHSAGGFDLSPFETEEAAGWLRKLTYYTENVEDVELSESIVRRLSNLPLAIEQTARAILRQSLSFQEFLDVYSTESFRIDLLRQEHGGQQKPIWASFAFSKLDYAALGVLDLFCFLNPDSISENMITPLFSVDGTKHVLIKDFPSDLRTYIQARSELVKSSLLQRNHNAKEFTLHRIVQDCAVGDMDSSRLCTAFRSSLSLLIHAWPFGASDWNVKRWEECEPLFPHILHLSTQYQMNQTLQEVNDYNVEFGKLLTDAGWYQQERGGYAESAPLHELAMKLLQTAPTTDHLALAYSHISLKEVACNTGEYDLALSEAWQGLEHTKLVDFTKVAVESQIYQPWSHHSLGIALSANRDYDTAIIHYKECVRLLVQDPTHRLRLLSTCGNALCLRLKGGTECLAEASILLKEAIESQQSCMIGPDLLPVITAVLLVELGNVNMAQEHWDEAFTTHMQAYNIFLKFLGRNSCRTAATSAKLSLCYMRKQEFNKAKELLIETLSIYAGRSIYAAEIAWTSRLYVKVLENLEDPATDEARGFASHMLIEFELKLGRRIGQEDLVEHLALWAR